MRHATIVSAARAKVLQQQRVYLRELSVEGIYVIHGFFFF